VERLREAVRAVKTEWPFEVVAGVVLLDHLHLIWTLPDGDTDYSKRIGRMKVVFTKSLMGTKWEELARGTDLESRRTHVKAMCGSGGSGSTASKMKRIWNDTLITCITTR
jgi:REP element-mobilizing transposase RayT